MQNSNNFHYNVLYVIDTVNCKYNPIFEPYVKIFCEANSVEVSENSNEVNILLILINY